VAQQGMAIGDAAQTYTLLTVGDGLVSQIPALLISTATGLVVTRAASNSNMGEEMADQLTGQPKALLIAGGVLAVLAFMPGLPVIPFLLLSFLMMGTGYLKKNRGSEEAEVVEKEESAGSRVPQLKELGSLLKVDSVEVEVGYNLISLVLPEQGGDFLDRVAMVRRQMALELGMIIPPIRILDNLQLEPDTYRIKLKGIEIARYGLLPDHYLAMDSGITTQKLDGIKTREPAFSTPAIWVSKEKKEEAEMANYTVVIKKHAHELLGRQEVKELIDNIKNEYSAVVDELLPELMTLGEIQKVLQYLLQEGLPVNNLITVLETLADYAPRTKDIQLLTEYVRQALSRQITSKYRQEDGKLYVISIDPQLEDNLLQALEKSEQGNYLALEPQVARELLEKIANVIKGLLEQGHEPIILTVPVIRRPLKELSYRSLPELNVISYNELEPDVEVEIKGTVS